MKQKHKQQGQQQAQGTGAGMANNMGMGQGATPNQGQHNAQANGAAGNPYINPNATTPTTNPYINAAPTQNPYIDSSDNSGSRFNTTEILTGALIGAAATYVLTNENIQKALFKGIVSMGDIIGGGLDEIKERFEDAKAEYDAQKSEKA